MVCVEAVFPHMQGQDSYSVDMTAKEQNKHFYVRFPNLQRGFLIQSCTDKIDWIIRQSFKVQLRTRLCISFYIQLGRVRASARYLLPNENKRETGTALLLNGLFIICRALFLLFLYFVIHWGYLFLRVQQLLLNNISSALLALRYTFSFLLTVSTGENGTSLQWKNNENRVRKGQNVCYHRSTLKGDSRYLP